MLFPRKSKPLLFLAPLALGIIGAVFAFGGACGPTAVSSLDPTCKPLFVRLTRGWLAGQSSDADYYMHRFYVRSRSLSPISAALFEQLEDWKIYRGALKRGTFTVCERSVTGSNAVLWVGYDSKIPLKCTGVSRLVDRNGHTIGLIDAGNRTVVGTTRHIWSAVCSEAPSPMAQYILEVDGRKIFLLKVR
jgi:hypothetical protein